MIVQDEQCYDQDVARFRRQKERSRGRETSESLTESDTDAEAASGHGDDAGKIWKGSYVFALRSEPSVAQLGWTVGRGPGAGEQASSCGDLVLCTRAFEKQYAEHAIPPRTFHARFSFAQDTAAFFVARLTRSPHA